MKRHLALLALLFGASLSAAADQHLSIGNALVSRDLSRTGGRLKTVRLENKVAKTTLVPGGGAEFAITFRPASATESVRLTADDFEVLDAKVDATPSGQEAHVRLKAKSAPMELDVRYFVTSGQPWMRKDLKLTASQPLVIEKVEVEDLALKDAYAPYHADKTIKVNGSYRWPLGQPLYTNTTATWWGMEFPAARNEIKDGHLVCGYLTKVSLKAGESYQSHPAVVGVADDSAFIKEAFFSYIDATRARPLRLQTQYNCWYDFGKKVDSESFIGSVRKVNEELVVKRGVPPLRAYVIDDGWQDSEADWSKTGVWVTNDKFPDDMAAAHKAVLEAKSHLGLWLSPGSNFGATKACKKMGEAGWRTLDPWMSMTDPHYMDSLEKRMVELTQKGVAYFKLDGSFGHRIKRNFDIEGFKGAEKELENPKYESAKELYLSLGTERLTRIYKQMAKVNPDIYIVMSNGAWLSPWWLQHIDACWLINSGDSAAGADRAGQLVYRDGIYYQVASETVDNAQFPLNSIFNHEPKKVTTGENEDAFRRYLLMHFSRGTVFAELYLKPAVLSDKDWSVLADAMKWLHRAFPAFKNSRMIGGEPAKKEVYGYTGWSSNMGYVSLHNPSDETREFTLKLDRALGLPKDRLAAKSIYQLSSPLAEDATDWKKTMESGGELKIALPPKAIRILDFKLKE